ncbi:iron chelate uptake ABC transporter family permease subunit [Trueperella bialowiezensis]|uniref:Iron-uptake system permease protein FeuC n=1 Tax=Trueperella bialowiezensis TaxID=312285 RepID=A0A3S4VAU2_9ACTO|nr:iron chelate uptake ABC transporter family permease subunit [Trueperella bialowiezensis]VEI13448.1 Iron-uptake system permease protein FeuC [Trueperella bialowiezensis]
MSIDIDRAINARRTDIRRKLAIIGVAAAAMCALFLTYDALDAWAVIGPLRAKRLGALIVVAIALSTATAVFQTVTRNRILSPSVMGFDSMYQLTATASVFFFGSTVIAKVPGPVMFAINTALMMILAVTLFMAVLGRNRSNVYLLVLVGIVVGTFLRSINSLLTTIMDPGEYLAVADAHTASFAVINTTSLQAAVVLAILALGYIWLRAPEWDILALGPDTARSLGIRYRREVRLALGASAVLVASATALVGPLMFFGLLIVNITVFATDSNRLRDLIVGSSAMGVAVLVGGQAILEHILHQATILPVILELVGGLLLLTMIVRGARK